MFRSRINKLLDEIGEVVDDFNHMGYEVLHWERPKPHPNPKFKNVLQLTITLQESKSGFTGGRRYDDFVRFVKKAHEDYLEKLAEQEKANVN